MASQAVQKRGKTTWAFTMPKSKSSPMAYLQLDNNYEHALFQARKKYGKDTIKHLSYAVNPIGNMKDNAFIEWERFLKDFEYCVKNFRSVAVDTFTELNDVRKLAEWGRNTQIPQIYYGSIYADYRYLVNLALNHDANVLFLHRMKDEWLNGERTGSLKLDGWGGIAYETQVLIEHDRTPDGLNFITKVVECTQNALLTGQEIESSEDENDFPHLAARIFENDPTDWED